jgi:prophage tail gpP-like protein
VPNPKEVAKIIVRDGGEFEDWESVYVQTRHAEEAAIFRFTCAEREPIPEAPDWEKLQFLPGTEVQIMLAGQLAVTGVIIERQVAYDANSHGIQLMGKGVSWITAKASVGVEPEQKIKDFDGWTFRKVAKYLIEEVYDGKTRTIGELDETPYPKLAAEMGMTVWDYLERIARQRKIILGSDEVGQILLIGDHEHPAVGLLREGWNIKRCNAIRTIEHIFKRYDVSGQSAANSSDHGSKQSEQYGFCPSRKYPLKKLSLSLTPAEQPTWGKAECTKRAEAEAQWHDGTFIKATIVTTGWVKPGTNSIWRAGENVHLISPMIPANEIFKIMVATYTQDSDSGTLTTLELVPPWYLNDRSRIGSVQPAVPKAEALP